MAVIASWCFRHKVVVVLLWLAALIGLGVTQGVIGSSYSTAFSLPSTESSRAIDLLKEALPQLSGESDVIVWKADNGTVTNPEVKQRIQPMLDQVAKAPGVARVTSPYSAEGTRQISQNQQVAYATVTFNGSGSEISRADVRNVISLAESVADTGLQVAVGGSAVQQANEHPPAASEAIGLIAAALILFIAFGSLLSMLLPLISAIVALIAANMLLALLSHLFGIPSIAPTVAALIGLGVGIDYALFIVTRYRHGLRAGLSPHNSAIRAADTSGRAVIFAGLTVCVAMLGLLVLRVEFLTGIGIASAIMVLITVLVAATLLPALLGFLGMRVLSRRERRRLKTAGPNQLPESGFWAKWADLTSRRPRLLTAVALLIMIVLTLPTMTLRLGASDQGNDPPSSTTRQAYDMLTDGFGPGFNGPLQLVALVHNPQDTAALQKLESQVAQLPGVASVQPMPMKPGSDIAIIQVIPMTSPQSEETTNLIEQLRNRTIPAAETGTSMEVMVTGSTAIYYDFAKVLTDSLPLFIGVIVGLGFILLLIAFRSLLVPATAAVMNLLAAGASFGVVVAFFQWGWGSEPMGLGAAGPVEAFLPVMMLAILFGLSMDYQVFLVSRMYEEWIHTRDNDQAVRVGVASTGRVITAAAAIMICVFSAFVFEGQRVIAEFGIGLASAVFIDAFVLRTVLVPALMKWFGKANWWLPTWLDRWLPHLSVEPPEEELATPKTPAPVV